MMALKWTFSGTVWTLQLGRMFICALPFIICGMLFGDFLHNRADQRKFTCFVYIILLIAAFMLFGQSLRNFLLGA